MTSHNDKVKKINTLELNIQQAEQDYNALEEKKRQEIAAAAKLRDETIAALMAERDALALEIKLEEYPDEVKAQTTCSVCGDVMRPFKIARGGKVEKFWACAAGNLSPAHDMIAVDG